MVGNQLAYRLVVWALSCVVTLGGCSTMPDDRNMSLAATAQPLEAWSRAAPKFEAGKSLYRLQVGDTIDVRFGYAPELNESLTVRPDGHVSLAWVGEVQVAGLTPVELSAQLQQAYKSVLSNPRIDIIVRNVQPQRAYLAGEVARPGEVRMMGSMSVLQAIISAGDFSLDAQRDSVVVIRQTGKPDPEFILLDFANSPKSRTTQAAAAPCSDTNPLACDNAQAMRVESFQLQPMDVVFIPKTQIAGVAQFFERYVNQILPIYRNMGLSFNYQLRDTITVQPSR